MRFKKAWFFLLATFLVIPLMACSRTNVEDTIATSDIDSIKIYYGGNEKISYTSETNQKEIEEFIKAYNEAKRYTNDAGTTPSVEVRINLKNSESVSIFGGTQGFQTVMQNENQFNITGEDLTNYFKQLDKIFSSQA